MRVCSKVTWVLGLACVAGTLVLTYVHMKPALLKKTVTLTLPTGEKTQVVYSALQADPEVVYDIKTVYQPLLERDPQPFAGKVINEPHRQYLRTLAGRFLQQQGPWAALAFGLFGLSAWWCRRAGKANRSRG
jgi:hypothetical protein